MLLALLLSVAQADSFLTSVPLVCTPTVKGTTCGDGPLEQTLAQSDNVVEHAALIAHYNGTHYNSGMIERIQHYARITNSPYKTFDLQFTILYSSTWGGMGGGADHAIRGLLLEAARKPYDPAMQLMVALSLAQYEAFIENTPWDQPSNQKKQVAAMLRKAAELSRTNPREGFTETLNNALNYMTSFPGYANL